MQTRERNGTIDFFKFCCSVMVAGYHGWLMGGFYPKNYTGTYVFVCGYLAVEFFFIVSGYLLAAKAATYSPAAPQTIYDANLNMIRRKFLRIFAYLYPASILSHAISQFLNYSPRTLSSNLRLTVTELLNVDMLGFPAYRSTQMSWYLSAMLFVCFLIYPVLCKKREFFCKYAAPILSLTLYGIAVKTGGSVRGIEVGPVTWQSFLYRGMLRAVAGISLGCVAYELKVYFDSLVDHERPLLAAFEIFGYALFFSHGFFHPKWDNRDFLVLLPLLLSISLSFSENSVLRRFFRHPFFNWLGAFSFPIYLMHPWIRSAVAELFPSLAIVPRYALYFVLVFAFSLPVMFLGQRLSREITAVRHALFLTFLFLIAAEFLLWMCDALNL